MYAPQPGSRRSPTHTLGAFAIVFDSDGKVLLSHRQDPEARPKTLVGIRPASHRRWTASLRRASTSVGTHPALLLASAARHGPRCSTGFPSGPPDLWNLPGGGVLANELPTEAVIREVSEETGLEVQVGRLVGVYGKPGESDLVFAFECRVVGGELTATSEADEHRYFDPGDLPENVVPRQVERIADALDGVTAAVRWHTAPKWSR